MKNYSLGKLGSTSSLWEAKIEELSIYPNPFTEQIIINSDCQDIEIYNNIGIKQVCSYIKSTSGTTIINTRLLNQGQYFIRVLTDDSALIKKIIKVK